MQDKRNSLLSTSLSKILISGGLAGLAVDLIFFPLDTIKTRLQSSAGFWSSGGLSRIYSGIAPVILVSAPNAAAFFFTYEAFKRTFSYLRPQDSSSLQVMAASCLAEFSACSIRVPAEVIKQRRQSLMYRRNSFLSIQDLYRAEGLLGFYQGFLPTILRDLPFACIQFSIYEKLTALRNKPCGAALAGGLSGAVSGLLTTPLDLIKTRVILASSGSRPSSPTTLWHDIKSIVRNEGPSVLMRGAVPRTLAIGLGGAIYFFAYEQSKSLLNKL